MTGRRKPHVAQNDASARWLAPHCKQLGSKGGVSPTRPVLGWVESHSICVAAIESIEETGGVALFGGGCTTGDGLYNGGALFG